MANETERSNVGHLTDSVSEVVSRALVEKVKLMPFVVDVGMPTGTNVQKAPREGSLTAESLAESTAYTFSANSEYTETSASLTAAKTVVSSKLTVEAQRFGTRANDPLFIARKQGEAIARVLDADIKALTSGFSTQVTATSTLTRDDVYDAAYNVYNGLADDGTLIGIVDYKGANELRKAVDATQATPYSNPRNAAILEGADPVSGFVGAIGSVLLYQTNGLPTSAGDDVGLVFNPELAFCGMYDAAPSVHIDFEGSGGFWSEISSYFFSAVAEWNDAAGCGLLSDS